MAKKKKAPKRNEAWAEEFRKELAHVPLSQMSASRALQMGDRTIRAYALGERKAHLTVVYALRYLP